MCYAAIILNADMTVSGKTNDFHRIGALGICRNRPLMDKPLFHEYANVKDLEAHSTLYVHEWDQLYARAQNGPAGRRHGLPRSATFGSHIESGSDCRRILAEGETLGWLRSFGPHKY